MCQKARVGAPESTSNGDKRELDHQNPREVSKSESYATRIHPEKRKKNKKKEELEHQNPREMSNIQS